MSQRAARVGDVFEKRYELVEVLGSGGIGTVFRAKQVDSERLIALKILHPEFAADDEFKIRFMREAQALSKLNHENIVTVYHLGVSDSGFPYLAMELIKGTTLRMRINEAPLPLPLVLTVSRQLCSAMACIHNAGIVHRDLKPENIVFLENSETEQVKIIDFGLALFESTEDGQKLTSTGMLIGTAHYMSPEQCKGLKADSRSDLYALAVCIYEMLSGTAPFSSDNPMGLMYKHVHAEIPQIENQGSSKSIRMLNEFLRKGMNKEPESRFQSAEEMEKAIALLIASDVGEAVENDKKEVFKFATPLLLLTLSALGLLFLGLRYSQSQGVQATKAATHKSSKSENASDKVKALLRRTDVSAVQKIQNLHIFLQQNGINGNESFGQELEKLTDSLPAQRRDIDLVKVYFALAENYMGSARPLDAAPYLEKFFKRCNLENVEQYKLGVDDYWTMKGYLCNCYFLQGKREAAIALIKEIAASPISGDAEAFGTALNLGETKLAESVLAKQDSAGHLTSLSRVARGNQRFDLSARCLDMASRLPMNSSLDFQYKIERAKFLFQTNKIEESRRLILEVYNNPELHDFFGEGRKYKARYDVALILKRLGMSEEARVVAFGGKNNEEPMLLLKAILLSDEKQFEESRKYLEMTKPTETRTILLTRLEQLQQHKAEGTLLDPNVLSF